MEIVCFSFNRGRLLKNAILSARFCCPGAKITIFDDCSDDAETLGIIQELRRRFNVAVIKPDFAVSGTRGGLHSNIRTFISLHATEELLLLMQDDTQFFRALNKCDAEFISTYFSKKPDAMFLYPLISRHKFNPEKFSWQAETNTFCRLPGSTYSGYSDVCIVQVPRARRNLGVFGCSEEQTSLNADHLAGPIAHLPRPFLVYLPAPYTVRGPDDALISKWWRAQNTGVHPVCLLPSEDVERLFNPPTIMPCANADLDAPSFSRGNGWPAFHLQGAPKWLRLMDRIERRLERVFAAWL